MRNRKILLRFDDICPTMNWEQFDKAIKKLDMIGATALLGVVPECKDIDLAIDNPRNDYWTYLNYLQGKGYTIAMHGLYHVFDTEAKGIVTAKKRSEFAGHSYEEQYDRIKNGKEILLSHNISTDVFFAPAHSYDDNTLKALYANGFRYISDGLSCKPYIRQGIICVPCRSAGIPKIGKKGYYTVVLHAHEWVRPDKAKDWHGFNQICDDYMTDIVSFEVYKEGPLGNQYIQMINERLYYWFVLLKRFLTRRILKRL